MYRLLRIDDSHLVKRRIDDSHLVKSRDKAETPGSGQQQGQARPGKRGTPGLDAMAGRQHHDSPSPADTADIAHIAPPTSRPVRRPGPWLSRFHSDATAVERNTPPTVAEEEEEEGQEDIADSFRRSGTGLGIAAAAPGAVPHTARRVSIQTMPRRADGPGPKSPPTNNPGVFSPPGSADPFLGGFPRDSSPDTTPDLRRDRSSPHVRTFDQFRRGLSETLRQSSTSVNDYEQYLETSDTHRLGAAPSIKSAYESMAPHSMLGSLC